MSYRLAAEVSAETLQTTDAAGTAAINLSGNEFANIVIGNAGNNILSGGGGADTLRGLGGNDSYSSTTPTTSSSKRPARAPTMSTHP